MKVIIRGLNKWYKQLHVLKNINITIKSNKFTTILGPSGCGKTTLFRVIAGLEIPDSGEIYFDDKCVFSANKNICLSARKRKLGMVFQEFALWPHMNVFENVAFSLKTRDKNTNIEDKVRDILKMVQLEGMEKRFPSQMSGGQQQRVSFARAVVSNPPLVLFDEPLSALDAVLRENMRRELVKMVRKMNLTAVYVTHDQMEAMSMSDEIIVMNKGEILQIGQPEEIYEKPQNKFIANFIGKVNWFPCKTKAVRPENIVIKENKIKDTYEGIVKDIIYLGDKYELNIKINKLGYWIAYYNKKIPIGTTVYLKVKENSIIHIE